MTEKIATLKTVFSDEGLVVRSSGALIKGVAVRRAKVLPDDRFRWDMPTGVKLNDSGVRKNGNLG